jgi:hypothetical protein
MTKVTMRKAIGLFVLALTLPAHAETLYVTERAPVALRAALADGSPVVKTVDGGAALDVLERADRFARVRDAQGAEGWIESRLLVPTAPARLQLERVQAELAKARADLTAAQTRVGQLEAARGADASADSAKAAASPPAAAVAPSVDDDDFPWGWLALAFAMLWLGFGAGVVWLRERHRKKLGGMYLRV